MARLHVGFGRARIGFGGDREPLDLVAPPTRQPRLEGRAAHFEQTGHRPVLLRNKGLDLALAFDDEAQRDRLDPPRRLGTGQLAPQHRRQCETNQIVERAACAIGVDQVGVELARMPHRVSHRLLGDRIERHAIDGRGQRLFAAQQFLHMPADRLALAIGVGREDQAVGALGGVRNLLQPLRLVGIKLPLHCKAVVGIDRAVLRRQVADMAITGQHLEIATEIFLDRFRLCRRFHNYQLH